MIEWDENMCRSPQASPVITCDKWYTCVVLTTLVTSSQWNSIVLTGGNYQTKDLDNKGKQNEVI